MAAVEVEPVAVSDVPIVTDEPKDAPTAVDVPTDTREEGSAPEIEASSVLEEPSQEADATETDISISDAPLEAETQETDTITVDVPALAAAVEEVPHEADSSESEIPATKTEETGEKVGEVQESAKQEEGKDIPSTEETSVPAGEDTGALAVAAEAHVAEEAKHQEQHEEGEKNAQVVEAAT